MKLEVLCNHWRPNGNAHTGTCAIGAATLPSRGYCLKVCRKYEGPERAWPLLAVPSRGFGDTIAKGTRAVGIKPCGGCKKRQKVLNRIIPYR